MKLSILILTSLLLTSCAPLEFYEGLPFWVKIIIGIIGIIFLIIFLSENNLFPDIKNSNDYETKDYKTNSQLNNIFWLLMIIIALLGIILIKVW